MKLNFFLLLAYVGIVGGMYFIPQFYFPAAVLIPLPGFVLGMVLVMPWIYKHLELYYWPITCLYTFCNLAYCVVYPICLVVQSEACTPPDVVRMNFLLDHLGSLLALFLHLSEKSLENIVLLLTTGSMGYMLLTDTIGRTGLSPTRDLVSTSKCNKCSKWPWLVLAIILTVSLVLNYSLRDPSIFTADDIAGAPHFSPLDKSFGYLLTVLIDLPMLLFAGRFCVAIDEVVVEQTGRLGCLKKWACKILLATVMILDVGAGICWAIFFELL